jgi:hypothetical protein
MLKSVAPPKSENRWGRPKISAPKRTQSSMLMDKEIAIKDRKKDRKTERQKDRETERQKDRKTERQKDRKTERQKDRKTERQKVRKTEGQYGYFWLF